MTVPLFLIPMVVGLVTQAVKPLLNRKWYALLEKDGQKIPRYGGMPSAHTAFVVSLATTVALVDGLASTSFAISVAMVIFILDDALRMRIFLSRHGRALKLLVRRLPEHEQHDYPYLEARLGHKLQEVIVGGLVGIFLTWLLFRLLVG